ncbi:MAG: magnesium transporter [Caldilineales bacterium]|nr:magnesium transporter [Caldilineales bacterium]
MDRPILEHVLVQLQNALERDDLQGAANIIEAMRPADQADLFAELDEEQQVALLPEMAAGDSADILEELDDEQVAELVAALTTDDIIRIVEEMEPDEAADLLGDISPEQAEAVLRGLEDPDEVRPLLIHPDESAGGLMTTEFLALRRRMTAGEAIEAIRRWQPSEETIYYLFVVDQHGRLSGVANLRQLIVAQPTTLIMDIMDSEVLAVQAGTDQEEAAQILARYDLLALPVVDASRVLLGVITVDDVLDVLEDEATEDIQRMGGAEPLERSYLDTPPAIITRKRIGWLLLLFVGGTLTGSVMRLFEAQLQAVVALAVFIPLLIGTGGNAGSQTIATIIRSLATKDIEPSDAFWVWWHEARVGILLGLGMAVAAFVRAITWDPNPALAVSVSVSILALVFWATSVGSLLPLAAARFGVDPALVSGPLMSTLVDATGLFIYFTIAGIILGL